MKVDIKELKNKKLLKVMFGNTSGANNSVKYELNEVNVAHRWNPNTLDPKEMGGFNFSTEDKILRWLVRGDTLYDITIPSDAEVVNCKSESAPNGVFRTNKIIISNPRKVTDDIAMELYLKSDLPEKSYYKALAGLMVRGYPNTCKKLIADRINKNNIDLALEEINDFLKPENATDGNSDDNEVIKEIFKILCRIKEEK